MVREARVACLNGDYAKGVALLSDLFVDTKDPNHIFNQGRCLEQNQRFEEAIGRFREYLRTETISASDRQAAEKHVAECEALQAKKTAAATAPVAAPAPAPTTILAAPSPSAVTNSASPTEAASVVETASPSTKPTDAGSGLRIGAIVVAGVGAAALVTGLVLNLKANSLADSIDPPDHTFRRSTESTRSSYETFAWVAYGVGAAGIVTGAVLYAVGWSRSGDSQVAMLPMIGPGRAGATLRSSF